MLLISTASVLLTWSANVFQDFSHVWEAEELYPQQDVHCQGWVVNFAFLLS